MKLTLQISIKIILATLFIFCLLEMPYGFYELVRFLALVGFGILAFQAKKQDHTVEMVIYGALAILFQPVFKIALGREIWNIVDVVVGIGLIVSLFISPNPQKDK